MSANHETNNLQIAVETFSPILHDLILMAIDPPEFMRIDKSDEQALVQASAGEDT